MTAEIQNLVSVALITLGVAALYAYSLTGVGALFKLTVLFVLCGVILHSIPNEQLNQTQATSVMAGCTSHEKQK